MSALWKRFVKLQNPLMIRLLNSPLHGLVSGSYLLIRVTGRKSGREYVTPVQYKQLGEELIVISSREYQWPLNLRGGAPLTIRLRGQEYRGQGEVSSDPAEITDAAGKIYPQLSADTLARFAATTVLVRIRIEANPAFSGTGSG